MTVNEHVAVFPDASVAVTVTVVTPNGNVDPDGGTATTVTPGQLSLAFNLKFTTAEHWFGSFGVVIFAGHLITGGCESFTVTVKLQFDEFFDASLTLHETVVVPIGKVDPEAGAHIGLPTSGQLSLTVGAV